MSLAPNSKSLSSQTTPSSWSPATPTCAAPSNGSTDTQRRRAESPMKTNVRDSRWDRSDAKAPPEDSKRFKWLKAGEHATILGVPLVDDKAINSFWRTLAEPASLGKRRHTLR
eukprot:scaffold295355_cov21-Tisochrysis_lutea.AAC.1